MLSEKLKAHLVRCEKAMQSAKPIIGKHGFPDDYRTVTVIGFISMLIEHQESVLFLIMHEQTGSAFALARPIVEGAYRGMWINLPATDDQVKKFNEKDEIDVTFGAMAASLDGAYGTEDFFQDLKTRSWKALNSYTHGGMLQIGRRFQKHEVLNSYNEGEIYEITTSVTTVVLVLISVFLKKHGHADSGKEIDALVETFGPVADGQKETKVENKPTAESSVLKAYLNDQGIRFVGMMGFQTTKPKGTFEAILDGLKATTLKSGKRVFVESADRCVVYHNIPNADAVKLLTDNGIAVNLAENDPTIPARE
jgi:hypothetical protein